MRKVLGGLTLLLCLLLWPATPAQASEIRLYVNDEALALDVAPVVEDGRTLVPVRAIAEKLGAVVDWDPVTRRVDINLDGRRLVLYIDNTTATVDGVSTVMDVPARIIDGRTLVPARFISENLNAVVDWDEVTRIVTITTYQDVAATLSQMESELLSELNAARARLNLPALRRVEDLDQMARSHASEMAGSNYFSHLSPNFGDTAARAAARGVKVNLEYLAYGLPDAAAFAANLLSGEQGNQLLAEDACFVGIGLYQSGTSNANIYAVLELVLDEGFFLGARQYQLTDAGLDVAGYALEGASLTVYLLDAQGNYTSRQSQTLSVNNQNGSFSTTVSFWQTGTYAVMLGSDRITVDYR